MKSKKGGIERAEIIKKLLFIAGLLLFARPNLLAGFSVSNILSKQGVFAKLEKDGATGIALLNPNPDRASAVLTAYDDSGCPVASETIIIPPFCNHVDVANSFFQEDIADATFIRYESDQPCAGLQANSSADGAMLDALPAIHPRIEATSISSRPKQ